MEIQQGLHPWKIWRPRNPWRKQDLNKKTIVWRWGYPAKKRNLPRGMMLWTNCDPNFMWWTHLFPQESWIPIMEISRTPKWERPFCLQQLCSHISIILLDFPKTHLPTLSNFSKLQPIAGSCGRVAHGTLKCVPSPLTFSWRKNFMGDPKQVNSHKFWETQITCFKYSVYSIIINYQI